MVNLHVALLTAIASLQQGRTWAPLDASAALSRDVASKDAPLAVLLIGAMREALGCELEEYAAVQQAVQQAGPEVTATAGTCALLPRAGLAEDRQ